jgi:activator of HSP90 ATPase
MILPKKDKDAKNGEISITSKEFNKMSASKSTPNMQQLQIGVKIDTEIYNFNQNFKCPPAELYNVLTLPELMRAFTNAPTQVDSTVGGKFSLFDGQIIGEFIELVNDNFEIECRLFKLNFIFVLQIPNKKIVQKWRFKTWPQGHFSMVSINLKDKGDSTELTLKQSEIPSR